MTTCLQCGHSEPGGFLFCPRCGTKAVESAGNTDPLLGRILNGKYRVESQIGIGAMGTVYLGEHIGLKKKVALKVLHSDLQVSDESLQRFQREGIAAGKFSHPHLIQIFDFDKADGRTFYLAMEFVEGVNLALFLAQRGRPPVEVTLELARQMLSCLAEAHRHGIVHRDLKPDNIMVSEGSRGELRVKVLDFGLSKLVDRRMNSSLVTMPGRLLGTPLYMAPEQVAGDEADERSDVYAAGLILYEMLAGERPFKEKDSTQLFITRPMAEAPWLRTNRPDLALGEELDAVVHRALEREREKRFQTAEEMLEALEGVPATSGSASVHRSTRSMRVSPPPLPAPVPTPVPSQAPPPAEKPRRRRGPRIAIVLVLAVVAGRSLLRRSDGGDVARARELAPEDRSEAQARYLGLLDDARVKLLGHDVSGALTSVNQAFSIAQGDPETFLVRAEIYRARGDLDTALVDYREAARGDPTFAEPLLGIGWIQLGRGELAGAEESFAAAAAIAPESGPVLAARGALASKRGDPEARALLEQAIAKDPNSAEAHLYLGRQLLDSRDGAGAIRELIEAKRKDPFATRAFEWLAEAYVGAGDLEQADLQLEEALRNDPTSASVRVQRGALLLERGRSADALEFLAESTERVPQEGRLWILRGLAAYANGDKDAATRALARGFEQGTRDPDARCLLGMLYQTQGKLPDAMREFEAVLRDEGEYPLANLQLGLALFAQGKYAEAAARFERVLAFDEESKDAHLNLALLQKNFLGDDALALTHLERYEALGGQDPRLADWLDELR